MKVSENSLLEYMLEVSQEAAKELVLMRDKTPISKLIQPKKRDTKHRLSEQELRIACINAIQKDNINYLKAYFSVETPTEKTYKQSGNKYMSGRTDLSLYQQTDSDFVKLCNIEIKDRNCGDKHIYKDIEKLIREEIVGGWFHLLHNTNRGTYASLFPKFSRAIAKVVALDKPKFPILFTFFDLKSGVMIMKKVQPINLLNPTSVFKIDYDQMNKTKSGGLIDGWMLFRW